MRRNLPVTQREFSFPPGRTLVSVTDLKGRITYCNPSFIEVSGYAQGELLGQSHNIVRHPDMPEEAFRDMWETIQSGSPWTGLVKNRRKNGDHYWVCANATPMRNGERITGYLSVRTEPGREAVSQAEQLYARMREQAQQGRLLHRLRRGQLVRADALGRMAAALTPGMRGRLLGTQLLLAGAVAACSTLPVGVGLVVGAVMAAATTGLVWAMTVRPIGDVVAQANRLASGDLATAPAVTARSGAVGELMTALSQLSVNLRTVVLDSRCGVEHVRVAANEISTGNLDLSARTESQASSLEQTAASMEQINATVQHSAASAVQGAVQANETADVARRSHEAVSAVVESMAGIAQSSSRIREIVSVVEGVAFQTNILALNAAVEAARAGDAGRGFAVVAGEVRALAQRTATAVKEIKHLIDESAQRVELGNQRSLDASARMDDALQATAKVRAVLDEISASAHEQQTGIAQVNEAVTHIDSITQQNAAMVEQLAASAQALRSQVESVDSSMRLFLLVPGDRTPAELDAVALRREGRERHDRDLVTA